ncbi:RING finger protein nhl-1-like protein [Aphelenchoides avenae]|nr:RING finger protein nhl-1-like protein [Aphelenchus avenae]
MPTATADNNLLKCPACERRLENPKVLPCGHSLCEKCLDSLVEGDDQRKMMKCPECSVESQVPDKGFPRNFKLMGKCN